MDDMEYTPDIYTLTDEDGVEHEFELWHILEAEGSVYYGLIPYVDDPAAMLEEDTELVILKVGEENGEEFLATIEDDEEYERIGKLFLDQLAEEEEDDEEEDA